MTPHDLQRIQTWAEQLTGPVTLGFVDASGSQALALEAFGRQLAAVDPRIAFKPADLPGAPAPALAIGERLFYQALPQDKELPPFLDALAPGRPSAEPFPADRLAGLSLPAVLTLYVAPACPFCPDVVRRVLALAAASTRITVTVVDAAFFPDLAARDNVAAVPTLILDGQARWVGPVPEAELVDQLCHPDPFKLGPATIRRLLEEGQAGQVAAIMAQGGRIFPALVELLADPRWSVRLGAMVAVETLAETSRDLAGDFEAPIWQAMDAADTQVKGDLLYVIGAIGGPLALERLQALIDSAADEGVREAAAEAMDRIREETGPSILS